MRNILFGVLLVAMVAAAAHAQQAPADRAAVEKAIAAMEQKINDSFIKKDVAGMKVNIADDGFGIDPFTGASPVSEFYKQLPTMNIKITDMKLADFKYHWIDANAVVMTYTWSGKGTVDGQPVPSPTYASTVYAKRGAAWKAVFHQETVAMPMPAAPAKPAAPAAPKK